MRHNESAHSSSHIYRPLIPPFHYNRKFLKCKKWQFWVNWEHSWLICQERGTMQSWHHDDRVRINHEFPEFQIVFNLGVLWTCYGNVADVLWCTPTIFKSLRLLRIPSKGEESPTRPLWSPWIIPEINSKLQWFLFCVFVFGVFFYSGIRGQIFKHFLKISLKFASIFWLWYSLSWCRWRESLMPRAPVVL